MELDEEGACVSVAREILPPEANNPLSQAQKYRQQHPQNNKTSEAIHIGMIIDQRVSVFFGESVVFPSEKNCIIALVILVSIYCGLLIHHNQCR